MNLSLFDTTCDMASVCFQELLLVSAISGAVVAIALLIQTTLSRFISPKWMYVFWLVIAIRFLLFVVPTSPTSLLNLFETTANIEATVANSRQNVFARSQSLAAAPTLVFPATEGQQLQSGPSGSSIGNASSWSGLWAALTAIWLAVSTVLLIRLVRGLLIIRSIVGRSSDPAAELAALYANLRTKLKVRETVELRMTEDIESPVAVGILRPVVLLPTWCARELDQQQLDFVLAHELIHVGRRDALKRLVTHLSATIHWFNPLAWLASRFADQYLELSCDQRVLNQFHAPQTSKSIKQKYRRTIARVALRCADSNQMQSALVGGFVNFDSKLVTQRIAMLTKNDSPSRTSGLVIAACLLCLLAVGYTDAQTGETEPADTAQAQIAQPQTATPIPVDEGYLPNPAFRLNPAPVLSHGPIRLVVGQTSIVPANCELIGASFDDPEIATATLADKNKLEFLAMVPGTTIAHIELPDKKVQVKKIIAVPDVSDLQAAIGKEFPGLDVNIYGVPEGDAVFAGHMEKKLAAKVLAFAKTQTELPVRNLTTDKQAVVIKTWIYEVNISKLEDAGLPPGNISIVPFVLEGQQEIGPVHVGRVSTDRKRVLRFMDSLVKHGAAGLLHQPVLVTTHMQNAEFASGSEFPTMVLDEDGNKKIDFRFAGTKLGITPKIESKETLILFLKSECSKVDPEMSPAEGVPGFNVRRVSTTQVTEPDSMVAMISRDEEGKELVILMEPSLIKLQDVDSVKPAGK